MNAYTAVYSNIVQAFGESFDNQGHSENSTGIMIVALVVIALLIVVQLFVVQLLWNIVLVPIVSVVRPMKTLLTPLGLIILIALLAPGCCMQFD
jgi:hypothetical protein